MAAMPRKTLGNWFAVGCPNHIASIADKVSNTETELKRFKLKTKAFAALQIVAPACQRSFENAAIALINREVLGRSLGAFGRAPRAAAGDDLVSFCCCPCIASSVSVGDFAAQVMAQGPLAPKRILSASCSPSYKILPRDHLSGRDRKKNHADWIILVGCRQ